MSHLTSEQLAELTARVNARLDEFDGDFLHVTRGHVRLVYDVVREFWEQDAPADMGPMQVTPLPAGWRRWLIPPAAQHAQAAGNGIHAMQVCEASSAAEDAPPKPVEKLTSVDAPEASNGRANVEKLTGADDHDATYTAEYDLLRSLAVDGIMPRQSDYDEAKTEDMPSSTRLKSLIGLTWGQLASELGLRMIAPAMRATEARLAQRAGQIEPDAAEAGPPARAMALPRTLAEVDAEATAQAQLTVEGEAVRTMVSSLSDANRTRRAALQDKAFALLRGLAVDGVMPPISLYNARREEAGLPDARLLLAQLGCDEWGDLAAAAGLRWHAHGKR